MFTLTYWQQEIISFDEKLRSPEISNEQAALLVRGLCYLAREVIQYNPDAASEVRMDYQARMTQVADRMGAAWIEERRPLFLSHGMLA